MGETSNFYEKCSSLSKKGDEKSLRTLLQMGISGNKTARVALRKTRNKKLLKTLIDEYLDNIPSEYNAGMILNLAVKVLRKEYLYVYLMEIFHEKKDLKEIGFFKSVKDIPLDKQEQIEVKKYIIDTKDFDIRLISLIAVEEREDILYALLTKAMDDGLDARTTKIFLANKDYLQLIQPELREAIEKRVEGTSIFATYLDLKEKDNQKCIADFEKISLIYLAVKENVWDYGEMDFYHNSISIAFKLCRNEELTSSDWKEIKESIDEELLGVHDGNNATKMLFDLLLILSKYDYSYAEAKLITIYNRTDLYSSKALEILGELHSEFAYKEFLKKIIIAEQETECFHTAVRLIGFFPEREKAIIEYIKILDDSRLVEVIHEKAQKALANKNKIVDESIEGIPFVGKKCSVLSNNIVLNELLIKLGEQIKATQFFAAVGFSFSSGLRLVKPLMDQVRNIYMQDIDIKYRNLDYISYYRYVDDILILVNEDKFYDVKRSICDDINKLGLELNDKEDEGFVTQTFEYLGYVLNDSEVTVRKSSILKIEQSIEELFRTIKKENIEYLQWKLNLKITGFIIERHKYGWLFFYSQITDLSLLFHLDDVVQKLIKRYKLEGEIKVKRFVRTYAEMHMALHETKYIPNLDDLGLDDKKAILSDIYQIDLSDKDERFVEIQFHRIMKREIRDIEKDIENIS